MRIQSTQNAFSPRNRATRSAPAPVPNSAESAEKSPTDQAVRISHFVHKKKQEGAQLLRQMSGLAAGQLVGMTLGSMIFAPLALKMGNLYIATGGAAVTGGAMALAASKFADRDISKFTDNKVGDALAAGGAIANSLPKIAYPTLVNATAHQKEVFYNALDNLPLGGVTSAPTIDVVKGLEDVGASGLATPLFSHNRIFLDVDQMNISDSWAAEVTTHEIGHTYDFTKGVGPVFTRNFRGGGFGDEPFISNYAETNRMEDYAESYAHYHLEPERLKEVAPDKFAALQADQEPGLVDKALDRPSVRDTGRKIGSAFEAAPRARNLLALGASLVGPFQLYRGAAAYEQSLDSGDQVQRLNGKLNMASGAALMGPGTAPLSLAVGATQLLTNKQLQDGTITVEEAEKRADTALTVATGPFGSIGSAVHSELAEAGLLLSTDQGMEVAQFTNPFGGRKSLAKVAGGFALGAATGGVISPLLHAGSAHAKVFSAATGTWVGGLLGAGVGLGLHMLSDSTGPTYLEAQNDLALQGEDKKLLAKVATPAVIGGVGGAVGGYFGGQFLGQMLGQALAGSAGGVTGAALGSYLGVVGGSYAAAKGGAKFGGAWAGLTGAPPDSSKAD